MRQPMTIMDDGIRLSAVLETPAGAAGACPLVIILHGLTSAMNRPHTLRAAEAMREAGFATLRFDLFGHGESGGEFRRHTLYKWIANTMAVIDRMRALGYTDLYLSGHSQGGLVAAVAGGMEADRIRGLILRAPAFMIPRGARDGNIPGYRFDPDRIPDEIPLGPGLVLEGNYIRVARTVNVEEAADRFRGPVLILHGDADDVVPLETVRPVADRYENGTLAVIPGESHHFDKHPEEMANLIRNFMIQCKTELKGED